MEEPGEKALKRPADSQNPGDDEEGAEEEGGAQAAKRPALSAFSFRPSLLHKATQSFVLRQTSLTASVPPSADKIAPADKDNTSGASQVGFLKLDNSELNPISASNALLSGGSAAAGGGVATNGSKDGISQFNHTDSKSGSFGGFIQSASAVPTFSSLSNTSGTSSLTVFGSGSEAGQVGGGEAGEKGEEGREGNGEGVVKEGRRESGRGEAGDGEVGAGNSMTAASVTLPEVQRVTGEEGEKKIVQVSARLYAFDASTHSWKERGRGDIRLNDACQRGSLFQSRLVMRASGSYRVLFNTHLWAEMKCERANQKSIRITAQDRESIAVFLITGNTKDIQLLYNAVDHRIEALKLNAQHSSDTTDQEEEVQARVSRESSAFDEEEDKESNLEEIPSSPESSVETQTADIRQKAVSLPSSADDSKSSCEGEREGEGEGEGVRARESGEEDSPIQQSGDTEPESISALPDDK